MPRPLGIDPRAVAPQVRSPRLARADEGHAHGLKRVSGTSGNVGPRRPRWSFTAWDDERAAPPSQERLLCGQALSGRRRWAAPCPQRGRPPLAWMRRTQEDAPNAPRQVVPVTPRSGQDRHIEGAGDLPHRGHRRSTLGTESTRRGEAGGAGIMPEMKCAVGAYGAGDMRRPIAPCSGRAARSRMVTVVPHLQPRDTSRPPTSPHPVHFLLYRPMKHGFIAFRTRTQVLATFGALALVALPAAAQSQIPTPTTTTVCFSGCDFATIQAAVTAAAPGGTISVHAGTYAENVTINKALTLTGAGIGNSIIQGVSGQGKLASILVTTGTDDVTIEGFTVDWPRQWRRPASKMRRLHPGLGSGQPHDSQQPDPRQRRPRAPCGVRRGDDERARDGQHLRRQDLHGCRSSLGGNTPPISRGNSSAQ